LGLDLYVRMGQITKLKVLSRMVAKKKMNNMEVGLKGTAKYYSDRGTQSNIGKHVKRTESGLSPKRKTVVPRRKGADGVVVGWIG